MTHRFRTLLATLTATAALSGLTACSPSLDSDSGRPSAAERQANQLKRDAEGMLSKGEVWAKENLPDVSIPSEPPAATVPLSGREAERLLSSLEVASPTAEDTYDRDAFGTDWADTDNNGCDQRNDALARVLVDITYVDGSTCEIQTGTYPVEPYTATEDYAFVRGGEYEEGLDIDHIVSLGNVWVSGGSTWYEEKLAAIANDPLNLMASYPSSNRAKGDSNAAGWLPANDAVHCEYVTRQIEVKAKYDLTITGDEQAVMFEALTTC